MHGHLTLKSLRRRRLISADALGELLTSSRDTANAWDREAAKSAKCLDRHGAYGYRDAHDDTMGTMKHRLGLAMPLRAVAGTAHRAVPTPACGRRASVQLKCG